MLNPIISNLFRDVKFDKQNGVRVFRKLNAKAKQTHDCFVSIQPDTKPLHFRMDLFNKNNEKIGYDGFSIDTKNNILKGKFMQIDKEADRRKGLGGVLELAKIIEMIVNKFDGIEVYSLSCSVPFHSKFNFTPIVSNFANIEQVLNKIADNKLPQFAKCRLKAIELQNFFRMNSFIGYFKQAREDIEILIQEYVKIVNQNKIPWNEQNSLGSEFQMFLGRPAVINNKKFYNGLFKENGIDFRI